MKGHIKITDKVYFVPDELPKPNPFPIRYSLIERKEFNKKMEVYEASKKTVEVSNKYKINKCIWLENEHKSANLWIAEKEEVEFKEFGFKIDGLIHTVKYNQPCEAEVTDKALITKI